MAFRPGDVLFVYQSVTDRSAAVRFVRVKHLGVGAQGVLVVDQLEDDIVAFVPATNNTLVVPRRDVVIDQDMQVQALDCTLYYGESALPFFLDCA